MSCSNKTLVCLRNCLKGGAQISGLMLLFFCVCAEGQYSRQGLLSAKQNPSWTYQSEVETINYNGGHAELKMSYDQGKYRIDRIETSNYGSTKTYPPVASSYIFSSIRPPIGWNYDERSRTAYVSTPSLLYHFAILAKQSGNALMQQRYRVPERMLTDKMLIGRQSLLNSAFYDNQSLYFVMHPQEDRSGHNYYRKVGEQMVAGLRCTIFEEGGPDSYHSGSFDRYWVEPRSYLVLRREQTILSNPRAAPLKITTVTKKITFLHSLPPTTFQLPAGTTAYLPESMKDIPLPPGVIRARMQGPNALLGFDPQTMFKPQSNDTGNSGGVGLAK